GAVALRSSATPLVWYLHDALDGRPVSSRLLRLAAPGCAAAIAVSDFVAAEWRRVLRPGTPTTMLYNVIDLDRFRPREAMGARLGKSADELWYAVVAPLTPLKGQDVFIEACARVAPALPQARFVLV